MNNPTISVVIPLYNKAEFIQETLRSVLRQQAFCHEIIVVDDGSVDGGADRVLALGSPKVKLVKQNNAGVSAARNRGIKEAIGDFVAFVDADDLFLPGFLQTIASMIEAFPNASVFSTGYQRFWPDGRSESIKPPVAANQAAPVLLTDFFRLWACGPMMCASSICIRRDVFAQQSIWFPLGERLGEDQELWFQLAEKFVFVYCGKPLVAYRVGVEGSATHASSVSDILPCYRRLAERLEGDSFPVKLAKGARRLVASHYLNVARQKLSYGDRIGAGKLLLDSRAMYNPVYWVRTAFTLLMPIKRAK